MSTGADDADDEGPSEPLARLAWRTKRLTNKLKPVEKRLYKAGAIERPTSLSSPPSAPAPKSAAEFVPAKATELTPEELTHLELKLKDNAVLAFLEERRIFGFDIDALCRLAHRGIAASRRK